MLINKVNTVFFVKEMETDGHHPMFFLCDDGCNYFLKYILNYRNQREIDFLVYELVCHYLLKHFSIPTPEVALASITENSFEPKNIRFNKKIKPGTICFASKELKYADLLRGTEEINKRKYFKQYANPHDLIKISLFDYWVDNTDRGKNDNFNLLVKSKNDKLYIYAFDNAFAFGGETKLTIFNTKMPVYDNNKLFNTAFFKKFISFIPKEERLKVVESFVSLCNEECIKIIEDVFTQLPQTWEITPNLKTRITDFLFDHNRLKNIKHISFSYLNF